MPMMSLYQMPRRFFSPDGGPSDGPLESGSAASAIGPDEPEYIREMKENKDWQAALENRKRPVLIQAGASWCGPCNILKPMLIEAVKAHEGKLEYLYVDIDQHQNIAQLLRVSTLVFLHGSALTIPLLTDLTRPCRISGA